MAENGFCYGKCHNDDAVSATTAAEAAICHNDGAVSATTAAEAAFAVMMMPFPLLQQLKPQFAVI